MLYACLTCGRASPTRYCAEHGNSNPRPNSYARGYGTTFRRNRAELLARHPTCTAVGCTSPATVADHDPPRRQLVASGVPDPDAPEYLVALCAHHHWEKTRQGK